jgi:hypothetical protein
MEQPENIALEHLALGQDALGLFFFLSHVAAGRRSFRATQAELKSRVSGCSMERFRYLIKLLSAHRLITVKKLGFERTSEYSIHEFPGDSTAGAPPLATDGRFSIPQDPGRLRRR